MTCITCGGTNRILHCCWSDERGEFVEYWGICPVCSGHSIPVMIKGPNGITIQQMRALQNLRMDLLSGIRHA
jgi:hypothetical protein